MAVGNIEMDIYKLTQFNISDYLQIIFRRKWLFILPFITVFLIAAIGSFFLPKIYRSTALVLVEEKQLLTPLVKEMAVAPSLQQRLDVLKEQILSFSRLAEIAQETKLTNNIEGRKQFELLLISLRKRIKVEAIASTLIQISFEDQSPIVAKSVVECITKTFVEESLSSQEEEAASAINFIKKQVELYKEELEKTEASLKVFKEKNLLDLPGSVGSSLGKAMNLQDALLQIKLDLQEAQKTKQMLQKQLNEQEKISVSKTIETNPVIQQLNAKLIELQTQLVELKAKKCTDEHPWIITLKNNIEKMEARIQQESESPISTERTESNPVYQEIESKFRDTEALIDSLSARQKELQMLSAQYEQRAKSVPAQEEEFTRLTRDMGVNESLYAMLLNRLETANISQRLEKAERGTRFRVVDPPRIPLFPIKPNKSMIAFLGFMIGSILGFGCVFLGEYTDHSFRGLEDAETVLAIPSLGCISKIITLENIADNQKRRKRIMILSTIIIVSILSIGLLVFLLIKG
ncbi:MAG: GNVR domain-containing protein [bacterium]|nr:GNVR domain-containing protein [bacterium]